METEEIDGSVLEHMRKVATTDDRWIAYQNQDMCSSMLGHLAFLIVGPTRTFQVPPKHYPDSPSVGFGWRYLPIGTVDLISGKVVVDVV